jgi:hypothetical protein
VNKSLDLGGVMSDWAQRTPAVKALVLIGSRERSATDEIWRPDAESDWDFQIITSQPGIFSNADWIKGLPGFDVRAYASRVARIGGVPKVNVVFSHTEADFVVLPSRLMTTLKWLVGLGLHRREGKIRRSLQDLAVVIRPGWKFLKGAPDWDPFFHRVVSSVPDPRLSDGAARQLAQVFECERVWTLRKIARGELVAAQRMLHRELAETNFRLLHELKLRRGERSFPEGRRIERVADEAELASISVNSPLAADQLRAAVDQCARTCESLLLALTGDADPNRRP